MIPLEDGKQRKLSCLENCAELFLRTWRKRLKIGLALNRVLFVSVCQSKLPKHVPHAQGLKGLGMQAHMLAYSQSWLPAKVGDASNKISVAFPLHTCDAGKPWDNTLSPNYWLSLPSSFELWATSWLLDAAAPLLLDTATSQLLSISRNLPSPTCFFREKLEGKRSCVWIQNRYTSMACKHTNSPKH